MTKKRHNRYIGFLMMAMLLLGGMANEAWATDVTYHILTLPIDNSIYHMTSEVSDKRLEAFKVTVKGQTNLELPAQYKSPLATGFTYYAVSDVTTSGTAVKLFDATNNKNKGYLYTINGGATPVTEGTTLSGTTADYYVVYTYNAAAADTIAKLDGSVRYNIKAIGYDNKKEKEKGFFALNRGRNNRPAVLPYTKLNPEILSSEDFMKVDVSGTSVSPYWSHGDNKNKEALTGSKFYFIFKFEGSDPYNIIIRTAYAKDTTYIEKNDNSNPAEFVYKYYKEGSLFANGTANCYIASDEHRHYNYAYDKTLAQNPTDLTEGSGTGYDARTGYYHGQAGAIWYSFALLNNYNNRDGFLFMSTRTVDADGNTPAAPYFLKEANTCNNLVINQVTAENVSNNLSISGIYPIKKLTFKIATPFYKATPSADHIISVSDQISQYTVENDIIETKYLPKALYRKYIEFDGKFYKDAACTQEITKFSNADYDELEGYKVYVGYKVTDDIPFKAITPAATYDDATWANATWYELTDEGSTQTDGLKLKYDGANFKNNGTDGEYVKESEFAFIGDPYELRVVYRNATSGSTVSYVGAAGTPPSSTTNLTISTSATEGYKWEIPEDEENDANGDFLLRKYKGEGDWYWNAGHPTPVAVAYSTKAYTYNVPTANAQTVTFNVSALGYTEGDYIIVTAGGTNPGQVTVTGEHIHVQSDGTASFNAAIKSRGDSDKAFTLSIQKYNASNEAQNDPSVVTVNQTNGSYTANIVQYSTEGSTRIKPMTLPTRDYTYKIVDKSGRIAVQATTSQTIYSPLSNSVSPTLQSSLPAIIVSPYLLGEALTFYSSFDSGSGAGTGTSRTHLSVPITQTPAVDATIYVSYTTAAIDQKPINLSEDQEFNVKLNGQYIYYDQTENIIKTNASPSTTDLKSSDYLWKLRNHDPYAMLIDNLGAREDLSVDGSEDVDVYNDDGTSTTKSRQKGAWVKIDGDLPTTSEGTGLTFDEDRSDAQRFIAKASVQGGVYEVMVATGDGVDAATSYYNIGRPAENTVKIYKNTTYAHGNDALKFALYQDIDYDYHLIDRAKHELLVLSSKTPDLALPADFQSPLVASYSFYAIDQITIDKTKTPWEYTPIDPAEKITKLDQLYAEHDDPDPSNSSEYASAEESRRKTANNDDDVLTQAKDLPETGYYYFKIDNGASYQKVNVTRGYRGLDIYVTYEANELVKFNTGSYLLKFLQPQEYHLEDGNDKLTSEKLEAVYPYTNGDGNLNIYGQRMRDEQMDGGASTRPRWVWYFVSENDDPYHVRIRSKSTINYNSVAHSTFLTTYAVHFNQDTENANLQHIVTGGTLPGIASETPTEYMVLGSAGHYKLLTTDTIKVDLNGDGDTDDVVDGISENDRQSVTSFEQYWKTYNMAKLHILNLDKSTDAYSDDPNTWVIPNDQKETLKTQLDALGEEWHSYNAYANAVRWNGYNDKSDGHEKKVVEKIEHWYQTFDMGNGSFEIESADIPPVLILLDLHGWEIMRLPLPSSQNYPQGEAELAALRAYDSPLVKEYKFYSNATKATGCHKYSLRLQNGAERDQIKVSGKHYTSTSLGDLPPRTATGVISGGAFNDQYVTYTVKDEYAKSYSYTFNGNDADSTYTETIVPSKFLVAQNGRFYKTQNSKSTDQSYFTKPIKEHTNPEGGNIYDMILSPKNHGGNNDNIVNNDGTWIGNCLWYIQPNQNIDKEMGIKYATVGGSTGEPWTEYETKKYYAQNGKAGFDPYNLQLQLLKDNSGNDYLKYLSSHQTSTRLHNGIYEGEGGTTNITLENGYDYTGWNPLTTTGSEGYDHTNLTISNQTFMAVSDANGNMQLMPRFYHTKRVNLDGESPWNTTLQDPVDNNNEVSPYDADWTGSQTTFFARAQVIEYHIINNSGKEALRYKRSGEYFPNITAHFKSPLATGFTYYTGLAESNTPEDTTAWGDAPDEFKRTLTDLTMLTDAVKLLPHAGTYYYRIGTRGVFSYKKVTVTKGLLEKQITHSFAESGIQDDDCEVKVRYTYDADADHEGDQILEGKWFTAQLAEKDLVASGTIVVKDNVETVAEEVPGTGVDLLQAASSKPSPVDADDKTWQWKFLQAPADSTSDYYEAPDPYDVRIFNRNANYTDNPAEQPSPMAVGIKVPNANNGADHFALLSHSVDGYALAVAGRGDYEYYFLNGASMNTSVPARTVKETDFSQKAGIFAGTGSQLILYNDVTHSFTYHVITHDSILAVSKPQTHDEALSHEFRPYLPLAAQTPLLNIETDYQYYGFAARPGGKYGVIPQTILSTLYGLYDDLVYVRYGEYNMDKTPFKVPNKKTIVDGHVARESSSIDVAMNINGELPYNIIWYNDTIMESDDDVNIIKGGSHALSGDPKYVWYFKRNDPYALEIEHKKTGYYLDGTDKLKEQESGAKQFMLLKKPGYDYGVLQITGTNDKLTEYGQTTTTGDAPNKFIIFGLSVHDLIYHLVIAKTCPDKTNPKTGEYVDIDFRETESGTLATKRIFGTTQRDLTSVNTGEGTHCPGEKYQLGDTVNWGGAPHTYSYHAGSVSLGDELKVPNAFNRPNCTFEFYIEGIYDRNGITPDETLNNRFKGLKLNKLMSEGDLIDKTVVANIVYEFDTTLATNAGLGFVTDTKQNLWYTFETQNGPTPYLAHYTNAWGLQSMVGRETRYTNDYLWTPLGDVYGFKMYNRYMLKNSGDVENVMTMKTPLAENDTLLLAVPGTGSYDTGNEIFELISGDVDGYFRVHPVINNSGTQYYVRRDPTDNYTKLSTTPCDWTFGLDMNLMEPYYDRAGYVGGLTAEGKTKYEEALTKKIIDIQNVVYDDNYIVKYEPGYYRLHNQPGVAGISPVRYASGYLHDIERTGDGVIANDTVPMHFYSREGVSAIFSGTEDDLGSGFTVSTATRGDIPVLPTESDPSTIFYFSGNGTTEKDTYGNPISTMQTQGLYAASNTNGDAAEGKGSSKKQRAVMSVNESDAITFSLMDIGGAVLLIHDGAAPATRRYLNYDQSKADSIYDLRFYHESPTDDAKWCMKPVQKTTTAGNGEMPLNIATHQGGDGYYYATFYAPFDVLLPNDGGGKTYNAYVCSKWYNDGVHPTAVPAVNTYAEGKFVPANTPVIIRTNDEAGNMRLTLPNASPSDALSCVFAGSHLEKKLAADASRDVYTLGLPMTSDVTEFNHTTGDITAPRPEFATNGVGFYINATSDKESDPLRSLWQRNNLYVQHNRIYYRAPAVAPTPAPGHTGPEFVPVLFGDEEQPGMQKEQEGKTGDGCVYDLLGRKVATAQEAADGTWRHRLGPGVYIIDGKKIVCSN